MNVNAAAMPVQLVSTFELVYSSPFLSVFQEIPLSGMPVMAPGGMHCPRRQEVGKAKALMVEETAEVGTQGEDQVRELSLVQQERGQTRNVAAKGVGEMLRRAETWVFVKGCVKYPDLVRVWNGNPHSPLEYGRRGGEIPDQMTTHWEALAESGNP